MELFRIWLKVRNNLVCKFYHGVLQVETQVNWNYPTHIVSLQRSRSHVSGEHGCTADMFNIDVAYVDIDNAGIFKK